jgi:hypothetical protein
MVEQDMQARTLSVKSLFYCLAVLVLCAGTAGAQPLSSTAPVPLLQAGHPIDWWFVFKFNAASFPACGGQERQCLFGGDVQPYQSFGQQYVVASSENPSLAKGGGCAGDTTADPVGATFDQVYNGDYFYVVWNDQFYDDPQISGCTKECGSPWGHSKGLLAWDSGGDGFVLQVTTPSWPAAGSNANPRRSDGNTLGCVGDDNVKFSQHFFALRLTKADVVTVLRGLQNASVVSDPGNLQIVRNGGPGDIQSIVNRLGNKSDSKSSTNETLSSGVSVISKPSRLHVPPWQMVSSALGGVSLRTATWWTSPKIASTDASTPIGCWDSALGNPGAVEIATSGQWDGKTFGLTGGGGPNFNHAKIGISISGTVPYAIFGDMNQQGSLTQTMRPCASSQNGRGGLFYVLKDAKLAEGLKDLMTGGTAPAQSP